MNLPKGYEADMHNLIPLCVPFEQRAIAAQHGALFDRDQKCWLIGRDKITGLEAFLPYRYRKDRSAPYIRPWMVPQSLWGHNLRALLAKEDWDRIRKETYARAGSRCRVCGGRGPKWPVEADEGWDYDDTRRIQTLKGVIALCPDCHAVRHWGKTLTEGRSEQALDWMVEINGWTRAQAGQCADDAMALWHRRSEHTDWQCDIAWAVRTYDVKPLTAGEAEVRRINRQFMAQAQARFGARHDRRDNLDHFVTGR